MQDQPLLTITRVTDNEMDPSAVGELDYIVHCQALERWLAAGAQLHKPQTVWHRREAFAAELRTLADRIESGGHPFAVTIDEANKLFGKRVDAMSAADGR